MNSYATSPPLTSNGAGRLETIVHSDALDTQSHALGDAKTDVERLGLDSEPVSFGNASSDKIRDRLKLNGATQEEIAFLIQGERVELNAMTSDQFIAFIEDKLTEAGIARIVPPNDQLAEAYRLFVRSKEIEGIVEQAIDALADAEVTIPDNLEGRVRAYVTEHPDESWEDAVRDAAEAAPDEGVEYGP